MKSPGIGLPRSAKVSFNNYTPLTISLASMLKEVMHYEFRERPPPLKTVRKHKNKYWWVPPGLWAFY
jgi:hypothetical protein